MKFQYIGNEDSQDVVRVIGKKFIKDGKFVEINDIHVQNKLLKNPYFKSDVMDAVVVEEVKAKPKTKKKGK